MPIRYKKTKLMTIKERKLLLFFLKKYQKVLEKNGTQELSSIFTNFFSRAELLEIIEYLYLDKMETFKVYKKENHELLNLIGWDVSLVEYCIHKMEQRIASFPTLSEKEKDTFFKSKHLQSHYLQSKPTQEWDNYDVSNYYSLLWKHGKTKRVWAIFTSDVHEEDKYVVTTKPSFFFDTEEEAIAEIEKISKEKKCKRDKLKVMSLWQIQ